MCFLSVKVFFFFFVCVFLGKGGRGGKSKAFSVFNILFFIFEINLGSLDAIVSGVGVGVTGAAWVTPAVSEVAISVHIPTQHPHLYLQEEGGQ